MCVCVCVSDIHTFFPGNGKYNKINRSEIDICDILLQCVCIYLYMYTYNLHSEIALSCITVLMLLNTQHYAELMLAYLTVWYDKVKIINLAERSKVKLYYVLAWEAMVENFSVGVCRILCSTVHFLRRILQ